MVIRRSRLDQLIDYWDPRLRSAFLQAIYTIGDQAQLDHIISSLEQGFVEEAIRAVGIDPVFFRPMDRIIGQAFEAGGEFTAASVPASVAANGFRTVFQFNVRNPTAERWLSDWAGNRITQIVEDQKMMVRETLVEHLAAGDGPRTSALDIVGRIGPSGQREGGMLGLTSSQAQWVRAYRKELLSESPTDALSRQLRDRRYDAAVRRAEHAGEPIPSDLLDRMVLSYKNRALRYRAESISRTETMGALHAAQDIAMAQAVTDGVTSPTAVRYAWRITNDERVRDSHEVMADQEVAMGEMFITGLGNELAYPGDPSGPPEDIINCRCWREPIIDFYAGLE